MKKANTLLAEFISGQTSEQNKKIASNIKGLSFVFEVVSLGNGEADDILANSFLVAVDPQMDETRAARKISYIDGVHSVEIPPAR